MTDSKQTVTITVTYPERTKGTSVAGRYPHMLMHNLLHFGSGAQGRGRVGQPR